ncbi:MAG: hypothetical protein ABR964_10835 [Tepidisphaeraceae bacterium]
MTLIVSAKFKAGVAIQADGRMTKPSGEIISDTCQKIFPIAGSRMAISHSGIREFKGRSLADALREISFANAKTKRAVADLIASHFNPIVVGNWCCCPTCSKNRDNCCFLVHGFDETGSMDPLSLNWDYLATQPEITSKSDWGWSHGSGHVRVEWPNPPINPTISEIVKLVDSVHSSTTAQNQDSKCGGHIHSLAIARYCYWTKPTAGEPLQLE